MDNFLVAVEAVLPLFSFILIGLIVKKCNILSYEDTKKINSFVFSVFLSISLFYSVYSADLDRDFRPKLLIFTVVMILILWSTTAIIVCKFVKENQVRGAMIQAINRSNFIIMGIPLMANIFGPENVGVAAMLVSVVVPLYNISAVIVLESFRGSDNKFSLGTILRGIVHNPLLRGAALGAVLLLLRIKFPSPIEKPLADIARATSPLALIILGASFKPVESLEGYKRLGICILGRLVLIPGIAVTLAWFLGFRGMELVGIIGVFGTPTAISSYAMAQKLDSDAELTSNCIVFSTGLACITLFLWILFFKNLGAF